MAAGLRGGELWSACCSAPSCATGGGPGWTFGS